MRKKVISFGEMVRRARRKKGLTQSELANLIDISPSTICRIEECYNQNISYKIVLKLKIELNLIEPSEGFTFS